MSLTSQTSWVFCSTKSVSWKTSTSIATTNTALPSSPFATLRPPSSPAAIVSEHAHHCKSPTNPETGKQKITDQIAQLKYKEPNSPKIVVLEQELVRAEAESLVAEAQLSNITREKVKAAYTYQFDALREHCEKVAIIAGYGKHLLELIDDTPVTPGETRNAYDGYEASKAIIQDCEDALTNWVTANAVVSSKLSTRSRTLSQRRRSNIAARNEGLDLTSQDAPINDGSSWVAHRHDVDSDEEDDQRHSVLDSDGGLNGENRGRTQEAIVA